MTISPGKNVVVSYYLNNPADTGTYYVRAVISDAITAEVLATLDLTEDNRYYSTTWTAPQDRSGTGRQLKVLYTVYDDPGYTIESVVYGSQLESWMVLETNSLAGVRAASQGASLGDIRRIAQEIVKLVPQPDLQPIRDDIGTIQATLGYLLDEEDKEKEADAVEQKKLQYPRTV